MRTETSGGAPSLTGPVTGEILTELHTVERLLLISVSFYRHKLKELHFKLDAYVLKV